MHLDEHDALVFRARRQRNAPSTARRASTVVWWIVAVVGAILFLFTIRALLARTAWTAGPSPVSTPHAMAEPTGQGDAGATTSQRLEQTAAVPMVYRCVDRAGGVAFQSAPCGPGQRMTRAIPAPPDIEPPRPRYLAQPTRRVAGNPGDAAPNQYDRERARQDAVCASARRQRDITLEQVGLARNFDLLRQLDDMVANACKGG